MGSKFSGASRRLAGVRARCAVALLAVASLAGSAASAQEASSLFHFRLSNPGARSLAFGGAFAGLADDATAAYANPAGLTQLVDPELSVELRVTVVQNADVGDQDFSGVGFVSFVYPRKRWSVAAYQGALSQVDSLFGDFGFNFDPFPAGSGTTGTLGIENRGLAVAYRVHEKLSIGLGYARIEGEFDATSEIPDGTSPYPDGSFLVASTADGTDDVLNAGFLWTLPKGFSLGGFIRLGARFGLSTTVVAGSGSTLPTGTVLSGPSRQTFELANIYGLGSSYRSPSGIWTASFEWDRVASASGLGPADELHLGLEVVVLRTSPVIALRLGAWVDPDRRPGGRRDLPTVVPLGNDEVHTSFGIGFAFKSLKLDLGFDQSDRVDTGSFSMVYAF